MKHLILLVAVLALSAGVAYAQEACDQQGPDSTEGADMVVLVGEYVAGSEVELAMTIDGEQVEISEAGWWESRANDRDAGGADYENIPEGDTITFTLTQEMIDGLGEGASGYIEATNPGESHWIYYNFDELCWPVAAPEFGVAITGPHTVDPGAAVVLTAVAVGFDGGTETYLWSDDSTAATLDLGVVGAGATGVYSVAVSGDVDGEAVAEPAEASFTLWVGMATPLAGGLGLGLLAGACALAGAVSIRRKK